ncbi:hypothetical protein MN032_03400 [Agromyces atrinae]|uniref:hypothetical protein n=1 Tax=Agromyces atrinae TaxID=592376 RepID=UPI001F55F5BE|nr:hypothetical protein [Agromyces atrinae]MCI2956729.1 hypothetical protein [Agromyces atrinae]
MTARFSRLLASAAVVAVAAFGTVAVDTATAPSAEAACSASVGKNGSSITVNNPCNRTVRVELRAIHQGVIVDRHTATVPANKNYGWRVKVHFTGFGAKWL